jgi:hypothetical protein
LRSFGQNSLHFRLSKGVNFVHGVRAIFEISVGEPEIFPREIILLVSKKSQFPIVVAPIQGICGFYHG